MTYTQTLHALILDLGYTIIKTDEAITQRQSVWQIQDDDGPPVCSSPWLGVLCQEFNRECGGLI